MSILISEDCMPLQILPTRKSVLMAMAYYADRKGGSIYPSLDTLHTVTCLGIRTIQDAIDGLGKLQILFLVKRYRGRRCVPNSYRIDMDRVKDLIANPPVIERKQKAKRGAPLAHIANGKDALPAHFDAGKDAPPAGRCSSIKIMKIKHAAMRFST
jgi:hypothetical protein